MANLIRWDPFREVVSLRDAMDRLLEDSFVPSFASLKGDAQALALDVFETDNELVVEASLPGFSPDQVDVSVIGNTLTIKGEMKQENEKEEKGKYHYRERRFGSFQRTIALPVNVNANKAEAVFEKGVLKLTLPKVEEAKPKRIELKVK